MEKATGSIPVGRTNTEAQMLRPNKVHVTSHLPIEQKSHSPFSDEGQFTIHIKNRYAHSLVFGTIAPISQGERRVAEEKIILLSDEEILETADAD